LLCLRCWITSPTTGEHRHVDARRIGRVRYRKLRARPAGVAVRGFAGPDAARLRDAGARHRHRFRWRGHSGRGKRLSRRDVREPSSC
jgi:hypothetical protein